MTSAPISYALDENQVIVTLNRPDQRNALNLAMWRAIPALMAKAESEPNVSAVILTGAGGAFAAGADISEFDTVYKTAQSTAEYQRAVEAAMLAIEACSRPVIAAIQGPCVGGGCGLALACDLRFVEQGARFGITPAKLGLVYGPRDMRRLVNAVGLSRAKDILFSGRLFDADEALAIGLIDRLTPSGKLWDAMRAFTTTLSANAPFSIAAMKQTLNLIGHEAIDADQIGDQLAALAPRTPDFAEGRTAFLEKRQPGFARMVPPANS